MVKKNDQTSNKYARLNLIIGRNGNDNFKQPENTDEPDLTILVGASWTGKSTLFEILSSLSSNKNEKPGPLVISHISGNEKLLREHHNLVFHDCENLPENPRELLPKRIAKEKKLELFASIRKIYTSLTEEEFPGSGFYSNQKLSDISTGNRSCLYFSFVIAIRNYYCLNLPLVLHRPFVVLDSIRANRLIELFYKQKCQLILIMNHSEYHFTLPSKQVLCWLESELPRSPSSITVIDDLPPELTEIDDLVNELLNSIKKNLPELKSTLEENSSKFGYEDDVYRFYSQSYKVFRVQAATVAIVNLLQKLMPTRKMNEWFLQIVEEGTGNVFKLEDNNNWLVVTRPMIEAFFHAHYFLEMAVKYGELETPPISPIPSGWAALVWLYGIY